MTFKHKIFYKTFRLPVMLYLKLKFGYKHQKAKDLPPNYIVLSNHTTDFDPLFVASSFKNQMYFVASEHITRWKKLYAFLSFGFEPIIRFKGTVAGSTVVQILRKVKKGANVCLFAEGVRSWDGVTASILPSTGQLVKRANCGLVTYKIVGGYLASPVWAVGGCRKGDVSGRIVNVYTKEQLASMTDEEVNAAINRDLYEDSAKSREESGATYKGKRLAEGLEKLVYICPNCGGQDCLTTADDKLICAKCGSKLVYDTKGLLNGKPLKHYVDAQRRLAEEHASAGEAYKAVNAEVFVIDKKSATSVAKGTLSMTPETITCGDVTAPIAEVGEVAIHGKSSIVFAHGSTYYEVTVPAPYSAYKFVLYFKKIKK